MKPRTRKDGFTLIEILVVVALIGLVMGVAIPNATLALKMNINNSTRELATLVRNTYDESILKGQIFRIAFDIQKNQYWVEQGERDFLIKTSEQKAEEEHKLSRMTEAEKEKSKKEIFTMAKNVTKKKKSLPKGVTFTDIMTTQSKDPITDGIAYAHVFPHGFIEKLTIHMKDSYGRESTLLVNAVSGKSRVFERYVKEQ